MINEQEVRQQLRSLTRDHANYKQWETRFGNALKIKADGSDQKRPTEYNLTEEYRNQLTSWIDQTKEVKTKVEREIRAMVHKLPIWKEWAKQINGVGELTIAYLECYVDLDRATDSQGRVTISKVYTFAGYGDPDIFSRKDANGKEKRVFCAALKTQMWTAAHSIMQQRTTAPGPFSHIYDDEKNRLKSSKRIVAERIKGGKTRQVPWDEANGNHVENAVHRKISKAILKQYVPARAALEGRVVRDPYEEEYLGKKHSD